MKRLISIMLTAVMVLCCTAPAFAVDTGRHYEFCLTAEDCDGTAEKGDIITVVFTLRRTDGVEEDKMYAFQNAITWNNSFFRLVPDSITTKSGVRASDRKRTGGQHDVYVNQLIIGGEKWSCENEICRFQLEVIASKGIGTIESRDAYVLNEKSTDTFEQNNENITVTVTKECEITFESDNGDTPVSMTVLAGEEIELPAAPKKDGYSFKCWRWNKTDYDAGQKYTVTENADFVAVWEKIPEVSITFDTRSSTALDSLKVPIGTQIKLPNPPAKIGYSFDGWELDGEYYLAGETYTAEKNVLFTAKWHKVDPIENDDTQPDDNSDQTTDFADVEQSAYYYDAVKWAVEQGITNGTSPTMFSPNASCTRGQMAAFLWRAAGEPEASEATNPFTDVKQNDYYYTAVMWALERDITKGTSATLFSPNTTCTRGQMATFLYRLAGEPEISGETPFEDVKSDDYFSRAVQWAYEKGITTGTSETTFSPNSLCTRGQIVTFLYRFYH